MGASIYWTPTGGGKSLAVGFRSDFLEAMGEAFGDGTSWVIGEAELPILRGMRAANKNIRDGLDEVIAAIEEHGEIRIWARW